MVSRPATLDESTGVAETARAASKRYVLLDGLRGFAALAIVIHHFTATSGAREVFASAALGVEFFFCLGGFVVAAAHHDKLVAGMPLAAYARRRLARIYPMYAVGTLFGLLVVLVLQRGGLTDLSGWDIASAALLNAVFLPYLNDAYVQVLTLRIQGAIFPFNNPAWSLFFLLLANGIYAATVRLSRFMPVLWLALAGIALCVADAVYGEAPGWGSSNFLGGFPRVLYSFFAGVVIYQAGFRPGLRLGVPAILVLTAVLFGMPRFSWHETWWLVGALAAIPVIVTFAANCPVDPASWMHPAFLYAGRLSYPIYCTHYPLMVLLSLMAPPGTPKAVLLAVFVAATLAVAHLAMRYVETPVRRWLSPGSVR